MSQAKVDYNKELKKNRDKELKKEKIGKIVRRVAGVVVGVAIVGWIVYSAVNSATRVDTEPGARETRTIKTEAFDNYESELQLTYTGATEAE